MPGKYGKFVFVTIILSITLIGTACSFGENSEATRQKDSSSAETIEIQSVPSVTPTTPEVKPQTEIIEPISPISPVSPVVPTEQSTMSSTNDAVQPIAGSEDALAAAIKDLSEQTGSSPNEIILVSIEAVEWSDTSLGCPQEGFMYAQVITPGYKIVLEAQGQQYQYHTDQTTNVVLCQE